MQRATASPGYTISNFQPNTLAAPQHKKAARLERRQKARCAVECAKRGDAYRAQQGRFERLLARVLEQKARLGA
jgi:hypothetical protein